MTIFITGATGFVGNHLAIKLADQGNDVHVLCRHSANIDQLIRKNIRVFTGDILNIKSIEQAMYGCEQVYHLAALAKNWSFNPNDFEIVNVNGTLNVLSAAEKLGIKKVVFTSTSLTLGPSNGIPVKETRLRPNYIYTEYARTKLKAEKVIDPFINRGLSVVIVNPTRLFGPGLMTEGNATTLMIQLYLKGKWRYILGNGTAIGNYGFIDDVVNGHILAMQNGRNGECYILGGENLSFSAFFNQIDQIFNKKHFIIHIPITLAHFFSQLELTKAKLLHIYPLITPEWVKLFAIDWAFSSAKAQKDIGYSITPFNEALQNTLDWLNQDIQ